MKIALYQPWIYLHGGIERSILELVRRSRHQWTIFTGHYDRAGTFPEFSELDVRVLGRTSVDRRFGGVFKSALQVLRQKLPPDKDTDAVVVWCDGIGDLITFRNHSLPLINICSTPLRPAFDPVYQQLALKGLNPWQRGLFHLLRLGFRAVDTMAWRHYAGVVATSREVKQRIVEGGLFRDGDGMTLAYPGIEWQEQLTDFSYEPFILVPGRIMWTKNIQQAIRAFRSASLPAPWKLVIAGYVDQKSRSYLADLKREAGDDLRVEFVEAPSDLQLRNLYQKAAFCLFTALNEDWGIVPLEAMSYGKAVVANNRGGPRESVVHGKTGFLLEPEDEAWAGTIRLLAGDPDLVRRLGGQAHAHVGRFTWDRFACEVDGAIERWVLGAQRQPVASMGLPREGLTHE